MSKIDFLKVSNFKILLQNNTHIELMVTGANLPGFNLGILDLPRPVVRDHRPGDSISYNDLNLTVLCDENLEAFQQIYSNIILSANPETCELEISKNVFDAVLFITTNKNNIQHQVIFRNAFFISVGDLQFESTSQSDEQISFPIGLKYSYWDFV